MSDEEKAFRSELGRRMFPEAEAVGNLWFLTANPKIEEVFKVPVVDTEGKVLVNEGEIMKDVPPEYLPLLKITELIANHLSRTGNITEKEAELMEIDLDIQMLKIEMITGKMPVWSTALRMYLSMAIKDSIEAHRMKGLLIKRFEAVLESTKPRKKRLGLF